MARPPRRKRDARPALSPDEEAIFLDAVAGTNPLPGRDRIRMPPPPPRVLPRDPEPPPTVALTIDSTGELLAARAPGVSHAQLAELRSGRLRPEETLDLHGRTAAEAELEVRRFLMDAARLRRRCVLIVHGRGLHSGGVAVVRDTVIAALIGPLSGLVHSVSTAHARDGGPGATYVMVRG